MKRKNVGLFIFFLFVVIGLILVIVEIGLFYFLQRGSSPLALLGQPPSVGIVHPQGDRVIDSGQGIMIAAVAVSDSGLLRVEFLVDGHLEQQQSIDPLGAETGDLFFPWFGSTTGVHQLSVVAYDLQGRASAPAVVQVGVQAVASRIDDAESAVDAEPGAENQQLPQGDSDHGAGPAPQEGEPPQEGAAPQEPVQPADPPADAPAPDQENEPEADLALPPQPQDQPPAITRFDVFVDVFGGENGVPVAVSAAAVGSGRDDLGLDRLVITWRNEAGQSGDFATICVGEQHCEIEMEAGLDVGRWVFSLQAFDTSGQASEPEIEIVEVIGGNGQPPGAAEHEFDDEWLRDHLRNQAEGFGFDDALGVFWREQGFGAEEFLEEMFPGASGAEPVPEPVQEEGFCLNVTVQSAEDGNLLTLEVLCDLQAEGENHFLLPSVSKQIVNTGDGGINLFIPEWNDDGRQIIPAGETFTWLDWDVTCGTTYRYAPRVDNAINTDIGVATGRNFAIGSVQATTPDCRPGSIGDVDLRAEAQPEGIQVRWEIAESGNWPDNLPDEGVAFMLIRFDDLSGVSTKLFRENIPTDLLLAGGEFSVLDDGAECGQKTWYSLAALPADRDLSLVSPGWLLRSTVRAPELPCPENDLGSMDLKVSPYWIDNAYQYVRMQVDLPAGFNWPVGENVELAIVRLRPGFERCEGPPCLGVWQIKRSIRITDEVRNNGLSVEAIDSSVLTGNYTYAYRLALLINREETQTGPVIQIATAPAPPPSPHILRLTASSDCPGASERCVLVEWDLYEQPRPGPNFYPAARIAVERVVFGFDQREFAVGFADTQFMDLDMYVMELELANGDVRRICHHDVTYRMIAYSEDGYKYGASPLTLDMTGECDDPLDIVVERRR